MFPEEDFEVIDDDDVTFYAEYSALELSETYKLMV